MAKYTQEVKDKVVEAAKAGTSLLEIHRTIGPNPKATQRYLVKVGINYKDLKVELKEKGVLKEPYNKQGKKNVSKAKKESFVGAAKEPVTETIVE